MKDKCFKLHSYPRGHKKFKATANNVQAFPSTTAPYTEQYQQLLTYIQTQMANSSITDADKPGELCIGISLSILNNLSSSYAIIWLVDSGASAHMC